MTFEDNGLRSNIMFKGKDGKDYATSEALDAANLAYENTIYRELDAQVTSVASRMSDAGLRTIFEQVKNQPDTPFYNKIKEAMRQKGIWLE